MPLIPNFVHNGAEVITHAPPAPMGMPSGDIVCWVVTAPDKHAGISYNVPYRIANPTDAAKLDTTGNELGFGFYAASETLKKTQVVQYVIVVEKGLDEAATLSNIIGGTDATSSLRSGIAAIEDCPELPTIIAAPGYSKHLSVINALCSQAKKIKCRVVADTPGTTTAAAIALSNSLGGKGTGHERVVLVDPYVSIFSKKTGGAVSVPASILAVGCLAAVKQWESPQNQGTYALNTSRTIGYNITDPTTEGNYLNKHGISYFGRTTAGGISFQGNRTVTGDFIPTIGLRDVISRKIVAVSQKAMGKALTANMMDQEITKISGFFKGLEAANVVMPGSQIYLHPELNTVDNYRNGNWYIVMKYHGYSVNEHMVFHLNESTEIVEQFLGEQL